MSPKYCSAAGKRKLSCCQLPCTSKKPAHHQQMVSQLVKVGVGAEDSLKGCEDQQGLLKYLLNSYLNKCQGSRLLLIYTPRERRLHTHCSSDIDSDMQRCSTPAVCRKPIATVLERLQGNERRFEKQLRQQMQTLQGRYISYKSVWQQRRQQMVPVRTADWKVALRWSAWRAYSTLLWLSIRACICLL